MDQPITTRLCSHCNTEKSLEEFDKKKEAPLGRQYRCKACRRAEYNATKDERNAKRRARHNERMSVDPEYAQRYKKESHNVYQRYKKSRVAYCQKRRTHINELRKKRYVKNREKILEAHKLAREKRGDQINARRRERRLENIDKQRTYEREYSRTRRETDLQYRIVGNLRNRIRLSLENKSECTKDLLGCSLADFVKHLESRFTAEMSWENYGLYWSIDHIKPCCSFDLTDPEQQRACFHWSNCQPLPVVENSRKGGRDKRKKRTFIANQEMFSCISSSNHLADSLVSTTNSITL